MTRQLTKKGTQFNHPALHDNSKIPSTKGKKKTPVSAFKKFVLHLIYQDLEVYIIKKLFNYSWPDLEVQKTGGTKNDTSEKAQKRAPENDTIVKRKKKKLFTNVDAGSYHIE